MWSSCNTSIAALIWRFLNCGVICWLNGRVSVCNNFGGGLYVGGCLFCRIAKSAPQHLLVTGEVVGPFDGLNFETAILAGLWPPRLKNYHGPHRVCTLCIRDVVALDALWGSRQVERLL